MFQSQKLTCNGVMSMQWDEGTHGGLSYNLGFAQDMLSGATAYLRPQAPTVLNFINI